RYAFWDEQWPLIVPAVGYAIYRLAQAWRPGSVQGLPLLAPLFLAASFATLPTGAVVGADHNHLLMSGLALCMGVGSLLAWLVNILQVARFVPLYAAVVALLVVYALYTSPPAAVAYGPDLAYPSPAEQEQLRKIALYVSQVPGDPVYADDQGILA